MGQKLQQGQGAGCGADMAPPGSSVMSGHPWQACATRELITVAYLPVCWVPLRISTLASDISHSVCSI